MTNTTTEPTDPLGSSSEPSESPETPETPESPETTATPTDTLTAIATQQEVETSLLRPLTAAETSYVNQWLSRAERLIRVRVESLPQRAQTSPEYKALVASIEGEMVARVFRNPEGIKQEDEGNYSIRLDSAVASGLLTVLDREWEALGAALHPVSSIAGDMDGYAAARYGTLRPDLRFQYGWPGSVGGGWL